MKVKLRVLSGAKQGTEFVSAKNMLAVGRHPSNDFQFDPQIDLDVSTRHASLFLRDGFWHVEDLGSSNGTLVNGYRIAEATRLNDTDQIQFGNSGPKCEFRLVKDSVPDGITGSVESTKLQDAPRATAQTTPAPPEPAPAPKPQASPTQRIRIEVKKQTQGLRRLTLGLFVALVGVAAAFFFLESQRQQSRAAEVATMQARMDSILAASDQTVQALQGQMQGMADAFERSRAEIRRLQTSLAEANQSGNAELVARLQAQLASAGSSLNAQQAAAQVDFNTVWEANQLATAIVYVEFGPGNVETGTAFAVRPDGTMITNRHVVAGRSGDQTPTRIGVRFANSSQVFRARVLAVSQGGPGADVAVIRVSVAGNVPTVQGLAGDDDRPRPGQPAAIIGFPLGVDIGVGQDQIARPTLTVGTISRSLEDRIQVDAWGAEGSSGSPIFDRFGRVVGILYGAEAGSGGRLILAAPASAARELLTTIN